MLKQTLCAAAATVALSVGYGAPAEAVELLPWSWGFAAIRDCQPGSCSQAELALQNTYAANYNADISIAVDGKGSAQLYATPSSNLGFPILGAASTVEGAATSTAFVTAFQGFTNTGDQELLLRFTGSVDFDRTTNFGFVTPTMAVLDSSVRDEAVASLWSGSTSDGLFTTGCASGTGAISVLNPGRLASSTTFDTASGMCGAGDGFIHVAPGQEFFVVVRLLTFQSQPGLTDALHTFSIGFSSEMSDDQVALASRYLSNVSLAVPEPSIWAMLIVGFGLVGTTLRARGARLLA